MSKNKIILITGLPGCGKSTLINELIKKLKNKKIKGILTPEIRKDNYRYGFKIIDFSSKKEEILASVDIKSKFRVSKYGINVIGIDRIVDKFLENFEKAEIIILDEIGKMEFFSEKFKKMLDKVFNSDKIIIATIGKNLLNKYKNKGKVFYLEKGNFNEVLDEILKMFCTN